MNNNVINKQYNALATAWQDGTCLDTLYRDAIRIMKTFKRTGHIKEFSTEKGKDGFVVKFMSTNNTKCSWMFPCVKKTI